MRYVKYFAGFALAAGMLAAGTSTASAQEWRDRYYQRQDLRNDYYRVDAMRDHIARDRARLNEDIRCGRQEAAARDAADLARDQRALNSQSRDIRRDQYSPRYRNDWR
jgi:hypothetical protein